MVTSKVTVSPSRRERWTSVAPLDRQQTPDAQLPAGAVVGGDGVELLGLWFQASTFPPGSVTTTTAPDESMAAAIRRLASSVAARSVMSLPGDQEGTDGRLVAEVGDPDVEDPPAAVGVAEAVVAVEVGGLAPGQVPQPAGATEVVGVHDLADGHAEHSRRRCARAGGASRRRPTVRRPSRSINVTSSWLWAPRARTRVSLAASSSRASAAAARSLTSRIVRTTAPTSGWSRRLSALASRCRMLPSGWRRAPRTGGRSPARRGRTATTGRGRPGPRGW